MALRDPNHDETWIVVRTETEIRVTARGRPGLLINPTEVRTIYTVCTASSLLAW